MVDLPARAGWWAALITVPLVLAGVSLVWPGSPVMATAAAPAAAPTDPGDPAAAPVGTTVAFDADSATLTPSALAAVRTVAGTLRAGPDVPVVVAGYCADTPGPPEVAQRLSERRAAAVADALVAAGVDRARLTVVGRGDAEPLATRTASRRVEIQVR